MAEQPQPAFTQDALAQISQASAAAVAAEFDRRAQAERQQREQELAARQAAANSQRFSDSLAADPVATTVLPVVKPMLDQIALRSALETDNAKFYGRNPHALEFESQVEEIVQKAVNQGRPVDRETAWNFFKGKNLPYFAERETKARQAAEERARAGGMTMGPSGQMRDALAPIAFDHTTPVEDMRKAMEGKMF